MAERADSLSFHRRSSSAGHQAIVGINGIVLPTRMGGLIPRLFAARARGAGAYLPSSTPFEPQMAFNRGFDAERLEGSSQDLRRRQPGRSRKPPEGDAAIPTVVQLKAPLAMIAAPNSPFGAAIGDM